MKQDEPEIIEQKEVQLAIVKEVISAQEAELIQRACEGDEDAFINLCKLHADLIYRDFFRQVRSITVATELTSKTFYKAQEAITDDKWRGRSFRAWLILIARKIFDEWLQEQIPDAFLGASAKFEEKTGELIRVPDVFPLEEEEDSLWRLVKDLSLTQRRLLIFRHIYHLSFTEIAMRLGHSESACKRLYYRALTNLKHRAHLFLEQD